MTNRILEIVDPNDNSRARYQYTVSDWLLLRRRLPADGDTWADDQSGLPPWWEPVLHLPPKGSPVHAFWRQEADQSFKDHEYPWSAEHAAGHVLAYTPNWREVRRSRSGVEFQPPRDNYWISAADLEAARCMWRNHL